MPETSLNTRVILSKQNAVSRIPYYYYISRNVTIMPLRVWYSAYYTIPYQHTGIR